MFLSVLIAGASARLSSMSRGTSADGKTSRAVQVDLSHVCHEVLVSSIKRAPLVVTGSTLAEGVAQG